MCDDYDSRPTTRDPPTCPSSVPAGGAHVTLNGTMNKATRYIGKEISGTVELGGGAVFVFFDCNFSNFHVTVKDSIAVFINCIFCDTSKDYTITIVGVGRVELTGCVARLSARFMSLNTDESVTTVIEGLSLHTSPIATQDASVSCLFKLVGSSKLVANNVKIVQDGSPDDDTFTQRKNTLSWWSDATYLATGASQASYVADRVYYIFDAIELGESGSLTLRGSYIDIKSANITTLVLANALTRVAIHSCTSQGVRLASIDASTAATEATTTGAWPQRFYCTNSTFSLVTDVTVTTSIIEMRGDASVGLTSCQFITSNSSTSPIIMRDGSASLLSIYSTIVQTLEPPLDPSAAWLRIVNIDTLARVEYNLATTYSGFVPIVAVESSLQLSAGAAVS